MAVRRSCMAVKINKQLSTSWSYLRIVPAGDKLNL
jgi:hypothetical protein